MDKVYISASELLVDAFRLAEQIYQSGFRPHFIVGVWRGGAPVGIAVQEYLDYVGVKTDHIAIRTSSYQGIGRQDKEVRVHGLHYIIENVNADDALLLVDDVFDSGRSIQAILDELKDRTRLNFPETVKVACPWYKPARNVTAIKPDYYLHETDAWLVFPHELSGLTPDEIKNSKPEIPPPSPTWITGIRIRTLVIPIVNVENNKSAPEELVTSLIHSGFAVLQGHDISAQVLSQLYRQWDQFFQSGDGLNDSKYRVNTETQMGYFSCERAETAKGFAQPDLKEYFQYRPGCAVPAPLRELTQTYFNQTLTLGRTILGWIQAHTSPHLWRSLAAPLGSYLDAGETMLRILRYPPLSGREPPGSIRAAPHEDINFITLLPAADQPGLEIKPAGTDWIPVDAPQGSIIINLGDMMQELTGGALPSTTHRVTNPSGAATDSSRITAPLFCHPVSSLRLSGRYTAGEYLHERLSEINPDELKPD